LVISPCPFKRGAKINVVKNKKENGKAINKKYGNAFVLNARRTMRVKYEEFMHWQKANKTSNLYRIVPAERSTSEPLLSLTRWVSISGHFRWRKY